MIEEFTWPVVPLCERQLLDVSSSDVIAGGLYRFCDVYKSGGGYDKFPKVYKKRYGAEVGSKQFVVQLWGCPLNCPYCYVTKEGIFGSPTYKTTSQILEEFNNSGAAVLHLMGGAPAIYLKWWKLFTEAVDVFHSDFLLVEDLYEDESLENLSGLFAVSVKETALYTDDQLKLFWINLSKLVKSSVNFYITFTGKPELYSSIAERFGKEILRDSFVIPVINYKATTLD